MRTIKLAGTAMTVLLLIAANAEPVMAQRPATVPVSATVVSTPLFPIAADSALAWVVADTAMTTRSLPSGIRIVASEQPVDGQVAPSATTAVPRRRRVWRITIEYIAN